MLRLGHEEGEVAGEEREMIHRALRLETTTIDKIMTPRDKMVTLPQALPPAQMLAAVRMRPKSRIPLHARREGEIVGVLHTKDLIPLAHPGAGPARAPTIEAPIFVPAKTPVMQVLSILQARRGHLVLVVDQYGKLLGLATTQDIMDELFEETPAPASPAATESLQ